MTTQPSTDDVAVVIRLPRHLRDALKLRAMQEDRSVASLMRRAARAYLTTDQETQP